ncbi:DUF3604 domain-containing protein [Parahaliea mediterranea]|uniref:DUF3604 domain-containing protein n=1 Tax=Parahaliea mediterranea TaxID=651086 RepID=UPI000E2E7BDE|nr:DUF3604 domain-containing protein [Parahaliea mediterranea]
MSRRLRLSACLALSLPLALPLLAATPTARAAAQVAPSDAAHNMQHDIQHDAQNYSPPTRNDWPTRVFWGDTHLHTNQSPDAFTFGNRGISPEQAYRFARGETVMAQSGQPARLQRPLDFLMVSDHSEFMGIFPKVFARSADIIDTSLGKRWAGHLDAGHPERILLDFGMLSMNILASDNAQHMIDMYPELPPDYLEGLGDMAVPPAVRESIWSQVGEVADAFNEPGHFTAFIGYEWTSMPDGNNLHRNVLFRDGADKTAQVLPFSAMDSSDPEDLWQFMADYEAATGGSVLAIPHNGNVSNGLMFAETTLDGAALTRDYAERRAHWEPIIEVTQIKGDGETHPFLSPNDEFADYETWDKANLSMTTPKTQDMLQFEYARSTLRNGLALAESLGANPFAFGMIGSTDSHTSLATADEDNFFGKMTSAEPAPGRDRKPYFEAQEGTDAISLLQWESLAAGYAAVWARENTRESLFDAMRRRETYATTGPRMTVRFFGGWQFASDDALRPDLATVGYSKGVPMGAHLPAAGAQQAPSFLIAASKDPAGANLDRLQVVKGWLDDKGQTHEKVYNVAASDARIIRNNQVDAVGNTVNAEAATYSNRIGDPALAVTWADPDFNPRQRAFYYVRVLEIPTPRWTTIDAAFFGTEREPEAPVYGQERAYTSPIWYTPQ